MLLEAHGGVQPFGPAADDRRAHKPAGVLPGSILRPLVLFRRL